MDTWFSIEKWWWKIVRNIGVVLASVFIKLGISANQLTVSRFIVLGPCALVGFAMPGYWWPIFGLICVLTYSVLDFCDGTIARKTNSITKVGGWLDGRYDFLLQVVVLSGATWHVFQSDLPQWWSAVALGALFSQAALVHHTDMFGGLFNHRKEFFADMDNIDMTIWGKIIVDIVITRSNFSAIFFTFRYVVIVAVLSGHLEWLLLVVAVTQNIRWIVLHIVMASILSDKPQKPNFIKIMKKYTEDTYTLPV